MLAFRSIARSSSEEKSSMCRKWRLPPVGGLTVDPVYDDALQRHTIRLCDDACARAPGSLIIAQRLVQIRF